MSVFYTNCFAENNKIYVRGFQNGERFHDEIDDYEPYVFLPAPNKKTDYHTIFGEPVEKQNFKSMLHAYKVTRNYDDANRPYYGLNYFIYTFINDYFPGKIQYDPKEISIVSIDIEVESRNGFPQPDKADEMITAITLVKNGYSITFGLRPFIPHSNKNKYVQSDSEAQMLSKFLDAWESERWTPDIVTGWNCETFDIPYLVNRIRKVLGEKHAKHLSPFKMIDAHEIVRPKSGYQKSFQDRKEHVWRLQGVSILDYMQLYKKFTYTNHESYALNFIAGVELGEQKLDYSQYGSLDDLYDNNTDLFFSYNIHDAYLVSRLEDKLNFLQQVIQIAYRAKINFPDALGTARPWDIIIHNHLLTKAIVIPQRKEQSKPDLIGAYVKDAQPGLYRWVVSFDFESLYPNLLSQHNISPETFVEKTSSLSPEEIVEKEEFPNDPQYSMAANGAKYRRDIRGFIPEIVDEFVNERRTIKKRMLELEKADAKNPLIKHLDNQQQAMKILVNGLYGTLALQFFRWFDHNLAESITTTGQVCTRFVEKRLNAYLNQVLKTKGENYVVAADTDSVYVHLAPLVKLCGMDDKPPEQIVEFLDRVSKEIQERIAGYCQEIIDKLSVYTPKLYMKREVITGSCIWRGRKMYVMNVWDKEGVRYKEPQVKTKGIEAVRSSTPQICRKKIREAIKIILQDDELALQKFVQDFHEEWIKLPFEDIAFPRSVNGLNNYSLISSGTPIHVRGAILYNKALHDFKIKNKYKTIQDRGKLKFVYLKRPNPLQSHVIAALDQLPEEFGLEDYIDYEMQFEKAFLGPVQSIAGIIGWNTEKKSNLMEFFA